MTPKIFYFFFCIWVFKIRRISRWFQIHGNNWKKVYQEKVICQKSLQVSSIEEERLQIFTLLMPITFLLVNFSHFSQQFQNQCKILRILDIQILWFLGHISTFLKLLKPNRKKRLTILKNVFYKCFLELLFTHIYQWTPITFQKSIIIAVPYWALQQKFRFDIVFIYQMSMWHRTVNKH